MSMDTIRENELAVHSIPHPFSNARVEHVIEAGKTVFEILQIVQPDEDLKKYAHVHIGGDYINPDMWHAVKPKANSVLSVRMIPQGGGGKNPLRTVLSVALLAATPHLGGFLSSGLSSQFGGVFTLSLTQKFVTGGLNFLGRLALNAVAPPSRPRIDANVAKSRTQFIKGAQNRVEPFESIPQVLGTHRMVPPYGARPYTETVGSDQYLRMLFIWGYGPLEIHDLKIGETPIEEFEGVEMETVDGSEGAPALSLYSRSVLQNDLQVKLTQTGGAEIRTTDTDVDEISVDVTFPNGLIEFKDDGTNGTRTVQVEVQYAPSGTSDWTAGAIGYKSIAAQTVTNMSAPGTHGYKSTQAGYDYRFYKRIDSVVIDCANGNVSVIKGQRVIGYDQYGQKGPGFDMDAKPPVVSGDKIEIAHAVHLGDQVLFDIVDKRNNALFGSILEDSNSFIVSADGDDLDITSGGLSFSGFDVKAKKTGAIRRSIRFKVPKGQYDVRLKRLTPDTDNDNIFDEVFWTALRGIRNESPINLNGIAATALRIKATDQLNGTIEQFNGVVSSVVMDWNGEDWVQQPSSNPASLYRHVLQGLANARPLDDDRIDLDKLQSWHERCSENSREFNGVVSSGQSVMDVLNDITAAGRASPNLIDGKWGVVEDLPEQTVVQHFTPRNSFGFEAEKAFEEHPDALRVRFNNRDQGWQLDERVVYDDGFGESNASNFESLTLNGVTSADQAWRDARYHMASARLRSEIYSFYTDIEHLVCTRGDNILLTHDVAMVGIASARIVDVTIDGGEVLGVSIDTDIQMEVGKTYVLRIRGNAGTSTLKTVVTSSGKTKNLTFLSAHPNMNEIQVGDLCVFGEQELESIKLLVKSIEPQNDFQAKITCVDAAPAVHLSDIGEVENFSSILSVPDEISVPDTPKIQSIQSGLEVLERNTDGSFSPRIVLSLQPPSTESSLEVVIRIKAKGETEFSNATFTEVDKNTFSIRDVQEAEFYDIEVTYVRSGGLKSKPYTLVNYEVIGAQLPPENVSDFSINVVGETAHLMWHPIRDIDLSHYKIKFLQGDASNPVWEEAVDLIPVVPKSSTSISVPAMSGNYLIKAYDLGGRSSKSATFIKTTVAGAANKNVVSVINESEFLGDKYRTALVSGALRLTGADSIDDWDSFDASDDTDIGESGYALVGQYEFSSVFDLGDTYTSRLNATFSVEGVDQLNSVDTQPIVDQLESWDQTVSPERWNIKLQICFTEDNPDDISAEWSEWQNFVVGDYTARGLRFRVVMTSEKQGVTPQLSNLKVTIDMPDRIISENDLIASSGGTVVNFANPFREKPAVAISAQNMSTGDFFELSSVTKSGFIVNFFNASGTGISRSFDYLAKGYGYQH